MLCSGQVLPNFFQHFQKHENWPPTNPEATRIDDLLVKLEALRRFFVQGSGVLCHFHTRIRSFVNTGGFLR